MKQQIFLALTIAAALCLTSCSPKETADKIGNGIGDGMEAVGEGAENILNGAESAAEDIMDGADDLMDGSTLGDKDGDGVIEDDQASGETKDTAQKSDTGSYSTVERVNSADDAVNFIGANVYSLCRDSLPAMTETRILKPDELDSVTYGAGIDDPSGIDDVIVSESTVSTIPFSFLLLRTDGSNTEELTRQLGDSIDPEKWESANAEKAAAVTLDDDIILVMGEGEQVDTVMRAVRTAANGVYENIGEVRTLLG